MTFLSPDEFLKRISSVFIAKRIIKILKVRFSEIVEKELDELEGKKNKKRDTITETMEAKLKEKLSKPDLCHA